MVSGTMGMTPGYAIHSDSCIALYYIYVVSIRNGRPYSVVDI